MPKKMCYNTYWIMPFVESVFLGEIRKADPMHQDVVAS